MSIKRIFPARVPWTKSRSLQTYRDAAKFEQVAENKISLRCYPQLQDPHALASNVTYRFKGVEPGEYALKDYSSGMTYAPGLIHIFPEKIAGKFERPAVELVEGLLNIEGEEVEESTRLDDLPTTSVVKPFQLNGRGGDALVTKAVQMKVWTVDSVELGGFPLTEPGDYLAGAYVWAYPADYFEGWDYSLGHDANFLNCVATIKGHEVGLEQEPELYSGVMTSDGTQTRTLPSRCVKFYAQEPVYFTCWLRSTREKGSSLGSPYRVAASIERRAGWVSDWQRLCLAWKKF